MDGQSFFSAYVMEGENWNGFVLPYFTVHEATRLSDYLNVSENDEWVVMNLTDEIVVTPVISKSRAINFVNDFPKKFNSQGFYLTANGKKIKPEEIKLEIRPIPLENKKLKATYDELSDTFIIQELIEIDELEPVEYPGTDIVIDGSKIHVYPIGAGSWIWSIASQLN